MNGTGADQADDLTFEGVNDRLAEIVDAVSNDDISLEEALDLFEEAIDLGMQASSLLEEGIVQESPDKDSALHESDGAGIASNPTGIKPNPVDPVGIAYNPVSTTSNFSSPAE